MNKALKLVMAIYGVGGSLFGLSYVFLPEQMAELQGAEELSAFLVATKMVLGASLIAAGVFLVLAARDPIRNILWVRFAIVFALLFLTVAVYVGTVLYTDFSQALFGVVLHGTFAVLLLILYPWQTVRGGEQAASDTRTSRAVMEVTD